MVTATLYVNASEKDRSTVLNLLYEVTSGIPGVYDYLLLAQSWEPQYCYSIKMQKKGCNSQAVRDTKTLGVHGLWAQYNNGSYPDFCPGSPGCDFKRSICHANITALPEQVQAFLNQTIPVSPDELIDHEWEKHGTCSNMTQTEYFTAIERVFNQIPTPPIISENVGKSVSYHELDAAYQHQAMFSCDIDNGQYYLSTVYTCWSYGAKQPFQCPPNMMNSKNNNCRNAPGNISIRQLD
ncbi:hypothetical protein M3P05_15950 [Sansalvadorimonas sp. 2012CJ34-2]|uniref:Uncharacterized protein n=1 Tax=Parendozoicomonas callyspongiae TaxID=2942213 RepID=A0ABT0PJ48_9GAMM|nr:T2 family ribonuclease [Sansalvadorimonas sp. 2012CJ34-2]MCL6271414.1 hypothetical protein [Sansalvadorimonas sp. 2012CJ34-2]